MPTFAKRSTISCTAQQLWDWHNQPGTLERCMPPWEHVDLLAWEARDDSGRWVDCNGQLRSGARVTLRIHLGLLRVNWITQLSDVVPGSQFTDSQVRGPFARWKHAHRFLPQGNRCVLEDSIEYELPLGALGELVAGKRVQRRLEQLFDYRHRVTAEALAGAAP